MNQNTFTVYSFIVPDVAKRIRGSCYCFKWFRRGAIFLLSPTTNDATGDKDWGLAAWEKLYVPAYFGKEVWKQVIRICCSLDRNVAAWYVLLWHRVGGLSFEVREFFRETSSASSEPAPLQDTPDSPVTTQQVSYVTMTSPRDVTATRSSLSSSSPASSTWIAFKVGFC